MHEAYVYHDAFVGFDTSAVSNPQDSGKSTLLKTLLVKIQNELKTSFIFMKTMLFVHGSEDSFLCCMEWQKPTHTYI